VSTTTENYLKTIFAVAESQGRELVGLGEIAAALGVTPGTVTSMMKTLQEAGFVEYRRREGVLLTEGGRRRALAVVRRHRLIELFLVEIIGLDWSEVHEEAEVLEHAMSDRLLDRIDELLGRPSTDPHGDPIPTAEGRVRDTEGFPLTEAAPPITVQVERVEHDESGFLEYLKESGLTPGARLRVIGRNPVARTIELEIGGIPSTVSFHAAQKITVRSV
jgi:DtxR family Mn-dependent transcriptional regulator